MNPPEMPLTDKIGPEKVGQRRRDGTYVVYVGGHHIVVCDGMWHHQIGDDGSEWREKIRCSDWSGPCPAKTAMGLHD